MNEESPDLVLASGSYVRRILLERAEIPHWVAPSDVDEAPIKEQAVKNGLGPDQTALMLALAKAVAVSEQYPDAFIIGADQMLSCEDQLLDKPDGRPGLIRHLQFLQGKTHTLHTATVVTQGGEVMWRNLSEPRLTMRAMSDDEIRRHVETVDEAVLSSVGGYRIEAEGIRHFTHIEGDWQAILGLPLLPLITYLRTRDLLV